METTTAAPAAYKSIPLDKIQPSRHQARKTFDEDAIKNLAESMKLEGLLQPVTVRPIGDVFELISGERRVRAAKTLNWTAIDAKITQPVSEGESAAKGLIENLQREDLNPIEEAEGFRDLNALDPGYWTHDQIAKAAGRDRTYVTKSINLLNLPDGVKDDVRRRTLNRGHAIELLSLVDPQKQEEAAKQVAEKDLSIKETRQLVAGMQGGGIQSDTAAAPAKPPAQQPTFGAGGQSFTFAQKGKHFTIVTEPPSMNMLDVYMQNLRCAVIDYLRVKGG